MSSGMGMRGTVGRCYGFFQDLQLCSAEMYAKKKDMSRDELLAHAKQCAVHRADYMECLHGDKMFGRATAIAKAKAKAEGHEH